MGPLASITPQNPERYVTKNDKLLAQAKVLGDNLFASASGVVNPRK